MTVAELITKLRGMSQDTLVVNGMGEEVRMVMRERGVKTTGEYGDESYNFLAGDEDEDTDTESAVDLVVID